MANKYMKRCSASLVTREILIKTMKRYHYSLMSTAKIKNSNNTEFMEECGKLNHLYNSGRNIKWNSHSGKHVGWFLQN